jgi:hypothetical protein
MIRRKKRQTMIYETQHRKLKIGQRESTKNWGGHSCYLYHGTWLLGNACSISGTYRVTVKPHKLLKTKEDNEIRVGNSDHCLGRTGTKMWQGKTRPST